MFRTFNKQNINIAKTVSRPTSHYTKLLVDQRLLGLYIEKLLLDTTHSVLLGTGLSKNANLLSFMSVNKCLVMLLNLISPHYSKYFKVTLDRYVFDLGSYIILQMKEPKL